jgi:ubiquinone biosynthesis monooxygenase Coq7
MNYSFADFAIAELDRVVRTLTRVDTASRPSPATTKPEGDLSAAERGHAAALMRVNHVGEVCAQALYQGQRLTARSPQNREALRQAATEEQDHLAWSSERIRELGGRPSLLNPLWYAGSLAMGAASGALGDRWNLAFLAETERQVEEHLAGHLQVLSPADGRTRALVDCMKDEEGKHRQTAVSLGAADLPQPVRQAMRLMAKVMTTVAYRV